MKSSDAVFTKTSIILVVFNKLIDHLKTTKTYMFKAKLK